MLTALSVLFAFPEIPDANTDKEPAWPDFRGRTDHQAFEMIFSKPFASHAVSTMRVLGPIASPAAVGGDGDWSRSRSLSVTRSAATTTVSSDAVSACQ